MSDKSKEKAFVKKIEKIQSEFYKIEKLFELIKQNPHLHDNKELDSALYIYEFTPRLIDGILDAKGISY